MGYLYFYVYTYAVVAVITKVATGETYKIVRNLVETVYDLSADPIYIYLGVSIDAQLFIALATF